MSFTLYTDKSPSGEVVTVTAMCRVGNKLWLGDSAGRVSVYHASSCSLSWSVCVWEVVGGAPSACTAMLPLQRLQRVALALECGRFYLCACAGHVYSWAPAQAHLL
ncbi:unnamed protein product [Diatraea saccharalis]|uniref:Uncharacterized protein n=1 Tax=Diatraea saccharalis TaxID=40085 RepID=A0A9N9WD57_9NEOP|nr:unnamed protein product [Diatraea saccharalis]